MSTGKTRLQADIVIVGAGGAGLTAGAAALESGVKNIIILGKAVSFGGNTAQTAGMFAVNSPAQKWMGIDISANQIFKEKLFLLPLREPPFYAVLGKQGFDCTIGGIKINHRMEVVNKQDKPIRGLYATGDCASNWEFRNYNLRHPSSTLTFRLCSGYIAGQNASVYLAERERITFKG